MARVPAHTMTALALFLAGVGACMPEPYTGPGGQGGSGGSGQTGSGGRGGSSSAGGSGGSSSQGSGGSGATAGTGGSNTGTTGGTGGSSAQGGSGGSAGGSSGGSSGGRGGSGGQGGSTAPRDGGNTPDTNGGGGDMSGVAAAPKLSTDVLPIVKTSCARTGCHDPMKKEHGMDVSTAPGIVMGWVNRQTADHCMNNAAVTRVVPGKPENSFVVKLIGQTNYCNELKRMPPPPLPALTPDQIKIITDWVAAGAKND